jgi:hypothetical protein
MNERRHSQRIGFVVNCLLKHKDYQLPGRVENISLNGVLVRIDKASNEWICPDDEFTLILDNGGEGKNIHIPALVVHYAFTYIGLRFIELNGEMEDIVTNFMDMADSNRDSAVNAISNLYHSIEKYKLE